MYDDNAEEEKEPSTAKGVSKSKSTEADETKPEKTVIVIIPFGVPGSGKSFIWDLIKQKIGSLPKDEWSCHSISSDGIRGEMMDKLVKEKGITRDEAFD